MRKKKKIKFCLSIGLILASTFAASQCSKQRSYIIKEKNGAQIIHNKFPKYENSAVSLRFVRQYGEIEPENEDLMFDKPIDLVVDSKDCVYILDLDMSHIKKFDANGAYIKTIGRKGQGPGEWNSSWTVDIDSEDHIYVGEASGRTLILDTEGQYLKEFRLKKPFTPFKIVNPEQILFLHIDPFDSNDNMLHLSDLNGNIIHSFCKLEKTQDPRMQRSFNYAYFCRDNLDHYYAVFVAQNRIEKYDEEGEMLFKADRQLKYDIFIRQEGYETYADGMKLPRYKQSHVTRSMGVDYKNRLWLVTFKEQPAEGASLEDIPRVLEFEIYNEEGILLYKFPFPKESFDSIRFFGKRVFFIDPHENGCVREYEIVED